MVRKKLNKTSTEHKILKYPEIDRAIQRGNEKLLEQFGSQEKVDEYLSEMKSSLYQKLFSKQNNCDRECPYKE